MIDTTTLLAAGASLPAAAVDALALLDAATETVDADTVTPSLLDDLRAGKVKPADLDKRVAAAALARVTAREAADIHTRIRDLAARRHDGALRANAEALIDQMRPAFDHAAATFAKAAALGIDQYTDSGDAIRQGGTVAAAYAALADAAAMLNTIRSAIYALTGIPDEATPHVARFIDSASITSARIVAADFGNGAYAWTDLDEAELTFDQPAGRGLSPRPTPAPGAAWLALIHAGHALHLNSTANTVALIEKAAAIEQAANARAAQPARPSPASVAAQRREVEQLEKRAAGAGRPAA